MDENKNLENLEEVTEAVEEAVEEAQEVAEDTVETAENAVEEEAVVTEEIIPEKKSKSVVIVAVILVVAIIAVACVWFFMPKNKYNKMGYVDISGKTVQDLADQMGVDLPTFLAQYELPEDMPADTTESAAYYNIPVKIMAQMFGMEYATMDETLHFPDTVTEETTWGEAEGEVLLRDYVGEENLEGFKEQYGFGDEVTLDTKWKEVRNKVDTAQMEARIEQEKAMAEAEKQAETEVDADADADAGTEVDGEEPVDDAAEAPAE